MTKKQFSIVFFLINFGIACFISYTLCRLLFNEVGDISNNPNIDQTSFKVCNCFLSNQYYQVGTHYVGERTAMRKELYNLIGDTTINESKNGYITFRFIVSCKGKTGRFRIYQADSSIKKTNFNSRTIDKLLKAVMLLKQWKPGKDNSDNLVDSYYQINFKIEKGKITNIF